MQKKIFITGGNGFLGKHLLKKLKINKNNKIFSPTSKQLNLREYANLKKIKKKFDVIYHLAAWTEAGDFCLKNPGMQWIINQEINTNLIKWWKNYNPKAKLIFIGTSCCYQENGTFKEENYMSDKPHESLLTYAYTKKMLLQGAIALQLQFSMNWLCVVPSTLYGKGYHNDARQMHFIFDLIRKIIEGKLYSKQVKLWGNGYQKREIIYIDDFVNTLIKLDNKKIKNKIINIGFGKEHSIRFFAKKICKIVNFDFNKIKFDTKKYTGVKSKKLNINKISKILKNYRYSLTSPDEGIKETIKWYLSVLRKSEKK